MRESTIIKPYLRHYWQVIITVLCVAAPLAFFALQEPSFLSLLNLEHIASQNSYIIIIAARLAFIMFGGGIDLSIGYQISLVSGLAGALLRNDVNIILILLLALFTGICCGLFNGVLVTILGIPPVIATVATQFLLQGLSYLVSGGRVFLGLPDVLRAITKETFLFLPIDLWLAILIVLLVVVVFSSMYFGRYILAIGENEETARGAGIRVNKVKIICYALGGFFYAIAALIIISKQGVTSPMSGVGLEWTGITALYLGVIVLGKKWNNGVSLALSLVIGVYLLALYENGMQMVGWNQYVQYIVRGILLAGSVALIRYRDRDRTSGIWHI